MSASPNYSGLRVTAATGLAIKNSLPGILGGVNVNKALVGTVTIKDGTTTLAVLTNGTTAPLGPNLLGPISFGNLTVSLTTAAEDITIIYA